MVTLQEKAKILRKYFIEGKSKSQITREVKRSRNTVRKYIKEHEEEIEKLENRNDVDEAILKIISRPTYDILSRTSRVLTEEIKRKIQNYIVRNKQKKRERKTKQKITIKAMHADLEEQGYEVSYGTVRNYHNEYLKKTTKKESYIKQEHELGRSLEFDYGEVKLEINGKTKVLNLAVFSSPATGCYYARLYRSKKMISFLDSHVKAFNYYGGVHEELVYDNLRQAVKRFTGRNKKEATEDLIKLSLYYNFDYRFCNIRKANEKGSVESAVEYIRQRAFSIYDEFKSIEKANKHLLKKINKLNNIKKKRFNNRTPFEMLELEREKLLKLKHDYDVSEIVEKRVNKYSFIRYEQNNYSVPDYLVGKFVKVRIYPNKLKIYYNTNPVARHKRSYKGHDTQIDINHYLTTLENKPGALKHSTALKKIRPELKEIYKNYYNDNSSKKAKDFMII